MPIKTFLFVVLMLVFSIGILGDVWYNNYENAIKAAKEENWARVIRFIKAALEDKKKPKLNAKTVGLRFVDYLPYYYLGLAHYRTGQYKEAQTHLKQSLKYGAVKKTDIYDTLEQMLGDCQEKLKPEKPAPQTSTRPVEPVKPKESKNAILIKQYIFNGDKFKSEGNLSAAKGEYNKAKGLIEQSGEEVLRLEEVKRKIQAVSKGEKREASIIPSERVGKEPKSKGTKTRPQIDVQKTDAGKVEDASAVGTRASVVDTLLEEGKRLYLAEKLEESKKKFFAVLQLEANHPIALQRLKDIDYSMGIRNLNQGIRSYFEGERTESEESLRKAVQALSKEKKYEKKLVSAYLFLAVVLLENHYIGEDSSGKLLQEAGEYITKIKTIEPGFELEEKYFSPKVVKIFSQD